MHICYIADANSIHSRRWILPFVERGYQVSVLSCTRVAGSWPKGVELVDLTRLDNVRKVRFLHWAWWLRRYLRRTRPDLLHALQITGAGWLAALAGYHPCVVSAWGSDILLEPRKSGLRRVLVKVVLGRCDRVTVPSQTMFDAAVRLGTRARVEIVPWGIETDVFRPVPDDRAATRAELGLGYQERVVLCPRKIAELYNIDVVIEAVRAAMRQVPDLRLLLLRFSPDEKYESKLTQMIAKYDMEEAVLWLPRQGSAADMARLYRMSDLVMSIPSSEGYGFSVYEAMASGCPTLVSDLPVFDGDLTDRVHTLKVPAGDVTKTARALVQVLCDADLRRGLRRNGLGICQGKSVQRRIEQTKTVYDELVGQA